MAVKVKNCSLRISTLFLKENGVLQQQWLATTCFWAEVLACEVVVGTLEKRLSHFARPSTYHGPIGSCPKTAKNRQNPSCGKKQPTPRPKWKRSVSISNQVQKLAGNTCRHALARFWPPGPMQLARGLAWWVPPGLMHFGGLGGISRKFPSLDGQHATLPMCLPPKLGAP